MSKRATRRFERASFRPLRLCFGAEHFTRPLNRQGFGIAVTISFRRFNGVRTAMPTETDSALCDERQAGRPFVRRSSIRHTFSATARPSRLPARLKRADKHPPVKFGGALLRQFGSLATLHPDRHTHAAKKH